MPATTYLAQGMDNTAQGMDNTAQGMDNTAQDMDNTAQGMDNTAQGMDNTAQGMDNTAQGMDNTYNTYTFGTQPLHFTRVVVARNESILIEVRTLSSFSITSRWKQSLSAHSSLG